MANGTKVKLKSVGSGKRGHLSRSLAALWGSEFKHLDNKGDALCKIPQLASKKQSAEVGGPKRLEPTRYGDWEYKGRCIDF